MALLIGVPREIRDGERRVAMTPDTAAQLARLGFALAIETRAGERASFSDDAYREAGVEIVDETAELWRRADVVLKVRPPQPHAVLGVHEADLLKESATLIGFIWPAQNPALLQHLARRRATVLAIDAVPRITRAQKMDALSSMANIVGYRAIVEAAAHFGRFFAGQITAAGRAPPASVLVIGAGVAGLAAIGAANGLGAVVRAFDTRPEVREQVRSMGAEFLELEFDEEGAGEGGYAKVMSPEFIAAEMALFAQQAMEVDIIVTTALIPGARAPVLITEAMVETMRDGGVIVDLAAEQGGNCALTVPGDVVVRHGVTIVGHTDLPSRMATQSSQLYGTNLRHLLTDLCPDKDGSIVVDFTDDVLRHATVLRDGELTWPPPATKVAAAAPAPPADEGPVAAAVRSPRKVPRGVKAAIGIAVAAFVFAWLGTVAPASFMNHFTVFVLSCFVGWQVIWNVTHSLHTPLMSVTNAISGIIVVGALLQLAGESGTVTALALIAILLATINVAGGFLVTHRMLRMFRKES